MAKAFTWAKKAIISIAGFALLIGGIILVPLPGPGLLLMLGGLLLLATEFDWAKDYAEKVKQRLRAIQANSRARYERAMDKHQADKKDGSDT